MTRFNLNLWSIMTMGGMLLSSNDLYEAVKYNRIRYVVRGGDGSKLDHYYTNRDGLAYFKALSQRKRRNGKGYVAVQ